MIPFIVLDNCHYWIIYAAVKSVLDCSKYQISFFLQNSIWRLASSFDRQFSSASYFRLSSKWTYLSFFPSVLGGLGAFLLFVAALGISSVLSAFFINFFPSREIRLGFSFRYNLILHLFHLSFCFFP